MMCVVVFIFVVLLFASYYFGDRGQVPLSASVCPPCDAETLEQNDRNDPSVPKVGDARGCDECVVDDCHEPQTVILAYLA